MDKNLLKSAPNEADDVSLKLMPRAASKTQIVGLHYVDCDAQAKAHRRKMQRRQANRKSAQLSRARKKAYLDDLRAENQRLQKLVNAFESQPELTFCINMDGIVTFMSERSKSLIYRCDSLDVDETDTYLRSILNEESAEKLMRLLHAAESRYNDDVSRMNSGKPIDGEVKDEHQGLSVLSRVSVAQQNLILPPVLNLNSVQYLDAAGYVVTGHMRASRIMPLAKGAPAQHDCVSANDIDSDSAKLQKGHRGGGSGSGSETGTLSLSAYGRKRARYTDAFESIGVSADRVDELSSMRDDISEGSGNTKAEYVCVIRMSEMKQMKNPLELFSSAISQATKNEFKNARSTDSTDSGHSNDGTSNGTSHEDRSSRDTRRSPSELECGEDDLRSSEDGNSCDIPT